MVDIMNKNLIMITATLCIISVMSGCIDQPSNTNGDSTVVVQGPIIGTWVNYETAENYTYKIVYRFYSNGSFFSGVQDETTGVYDVSLWGTFNISDDRIYMVAGEPPSTADLKYSISADGRTLLLYYEDDINFDVYTREQ
jgi:hypothetical protein